MSSVETSFERWGLAKVPSKADDADALVRLMNFAQDARGPVCAPVIDKDDLIGPFERAHYLCEPDIECRCAPFFVIERHNHRILESAFRFHGSRSHIRFTPLLTCGMAKAQAAAPIH